MFPGQKNCSPGFMNYWKYGCYMVDFGGSYWSYSEARCQEYGPNVHLAGKKYLWWKYSLTSPQFWQAF